MSENSKKNNKHHHNTMLLHTLPHQSMSSNLKSIPIVESISHSVAYTYEDEHALSNIYQNKAKGFTYGRTGNANCNQLEQKLNLLENGIGAVAFTTGMAAYDALFFCLLSSQTHIIAAKFLFANTISLLNSYSKKFGVKISYVDTTNPNEVEQAIQTNTKIILTETIANPCTQISALTEIGIIAKKYNLIYVIDNTVTTPILFQPKTLGASIVIHSLTKSISGHSRALGGIIIDTGLFDWQTYNNIEEQYKIYAEQAFLMQIRKKSLRDKGATLSAMQADLILIGLETLPLRIQQANVNANIIAEYLNQHKYIKQVMHPSLIQHPQHNLAKKYFNNNYGYLLSFKIDESIKPFDFLHKLKLITNCSSIGDNRSLIIHPASTIFSEMPINQLDEIGIDNTTFRLSIGIEHSTDLINAIEDAFK